ncbi:MAG TPA: TonB-dependent receptor [Blastocatellia bacterium]|nr:TonB-dependent receptor [Blastocatellia bacterium]
MRTWRLYFLAGIILTSLCAPLAQTSTGSIRGTVTDPTGAVLPNVTVIIRNADTNSERKLTTNAEGIFNADNLPPGEYEIVAENTGFRRQRMQATVQTGGSITADFEMTVGTTNETVDITAGQGQVNTSDYKIDGVITRERIENLPLNGRNFLELAQMEPGVSVTTVANPQGSINSFTRVSIGGVSGALTRISVDGASVNDRVTGGTAQNFSQESVQEFQMSTFNFDLSTSVTSIGSVNIVSRTGSNGIRGSGFFFFRDHNMAAYPNLRRSALDPDPFFARRQSGFTVSGPFKKDKLFWFTNFEYNNQVSVFEVTHTDRNTTVPERGVFANAFDHVGQAPLRAKMFNLRFDYRASEKHTAFLRYSEEHNKSLQFVSGFESSWIRGKNNAYNTVLGVTSVLTPRLVNDFRYNWGILTAALGLPGPQDCSGIGCLGTGGPRITVGGTGFAIGAADGAPQDRANRTYQMTNNLSWQKGNHRIRFGGEWEHYVRFGAWARQETGVVNLFGPEQVRAQNITLYNALPASLRTTTAGAPTLADILKLPLNTFSIGIGDQSSPAPFNRETARRNDRYRLYVQDAWQIVPSFTFNFGLAWSHEDNIRNYDLPKPEYLRPIFGPGANLAPPPKEYKLFAPALGFAWTLDKAKKTVLRGGSGIYYDSDLGFTRIQERRLIGPWGNGRVLIPGSAIPNPLCNPTCPTGQPATLQQLAPGAMNGQQAIDLIAPIRTSETAKYPQATNLAIRNIEVYKTGGELFDYGTRTPYSFQVTTGIQREVMRNTILTADFVMRRGVAFGGPHSVFEVDYNRFNSVRNVAFDPITQAVTATTPNRVLRACTAAERNDPKVQCSNGTIGVYQSGSNTRYVGLHMKLDKRFANRYQFTASYALSTYNSWNGVINLDNLFESYGLNAGDRPHRFNFSGIVELPDYNGDNRFLRGAFRGWQVSSITQFSSAPPLNSFVSIDTDGDGISFFIPQGMKWNGFGRGQSASDIRKFVETYNADVIARSKPLPANPTAAQTAACTLIVPSTNERRCGVRTPLNQVYPLITLPNEIDNGDTLATTDLRVTRAIKFSERLQLRLIGEVFNLFNIANLDGYTGSLQSLSYGTPTTRANQVFGSGGPRAFQLAARFSF